ncbi:hypothetical protein SAXI111661_06490 [Saccharomonospora xinjiangensis]|uniref:hypothetical protein n=1 Tax=Saccharomonospora xinjiangensis TaxID=75294 RepID=UPI00106F40C2|nr:hypothetical protein [Saccharomonospora xinjiangensis]QBQ59520.1 hypothetical protein EYD13_05750 [Saccharomonospora xinjiangensis]
MALAAGLFVVLAVAASSAGWWVLVALPLAGVLTWVAGRAANGTGSRAALATTTARDWCLLVLCATVPAAYLARAVTPVAGLAVGYPAVAVAVLLVASAADALGARLPGRTPRWAAAAGLALAAAFVAVCVAITPATPTLAEARPPTAGLLVAVVVALPLFAELRGNRLVAAVVISLAVAAGALYQLGPVRLGLSPTSLRDVLAAADASALTSLLVAVAVLAGLVGAVRCTGRLREAGERIAGTTGWSRPAVAAVLAACVAAALLGPVAATYLAALASLADVVRRLVARRAE